MRARPRYVVWNAALAIGYVVTSYLGLSGDATHGYTTVASPPTALALVAVFAVDARMWPGVFFGTLVIKLLDGVPFGVASVIGVGNAAEALLGAALLRRLGFRPGLERLRDVMMLLAVTALVTAPLCATVASSALLVGRVVPADRLADAWFGRWWGHVAADIIVAPAILTWIADRRIDPKRLVEAIALAAALVLSVVFVVLEPTPPWPKGTQATFILFPMLAWSAIRFGPRGAATALLAVTTTVMIMTARDVGPFVTVTEYRGFASIQSFVTVLGLSTMFLAAAAWEREREHVRAHTSEARRAATVEAAIDAIMTMDESGRIHEANRAAERLFGLSGRAILGKRLAGLLGSEVLAVDDVGRRREVEARRADGTVFDAEIIVVPLPTTGPPAYTGFVRDVTAVRAAERAVRHARDDLERTVAERTCELRATNEQLVRRERQLSEAYALAHIGSFEWDVASGRMRWSDEMYRLFGVEPSTFSPTLDGALELIHENERARAREVVANMLARRSAFVLEESLTRLDGTVSFVAIRGSVVVDEDGDAVSVIGTCQDVTERRLAELSTARLAAIVEGSEDAIVAISREGVVETVNRGAERMFGYVDGEIIGRPVESLFAPERLEVHRAAMERIRRGEHVPAFETIALGKGGLRFDASVQMSPVLDTNAEIVGASLVTRDITESKTIERRMHATLKEKEVLLAEVHHRVKNNLQIVSSLLHLQATGVSDSARRALEESENRVMAIALVHELLHVREGGDRVAAREYVEKLVTSLRVTYGTNVEVRVVIEPEDATLALDTAVACGLVTNELVSNAFKHAFPGRTNGHVDVVLERVEDTVNLVIADDGVGIAPDIDWRQLPTLGLQVVLALTKQLHGTIGLAKDRFVGTAFRLVFPA